MVLQKSGEGFITYMTSQYKRVPKLPAKVPRYCFLFVSLATMSGSRTPQHLWPVDRYEKCGTAAATKPVIPLTGAWPLGSSDPRHFPRFVSGSPKEGVAGIATYFFLWFPRQGNVKGSALPRSRHRIPFIFDINPGSKCRSSIPGRLFSQAAATCLQLISCAAWCLLCATYPTQEGRVGTSPGRASYVPSPKNEASECLGIHNKSALFPPFSTVTQRNHPLLQRLAINLQPQSHSLLDRHRPILCLEKSGASYIHPSTKTSWRQTYIGFFQPDTMVVDVDGHCNHVLALLVPQVCYSSPHSSSSTGDDAIITPQGRH